MASIPIVYPNMFPAYIEPPIINAIERDPIFLLIEEAINFSLRYHNLHSWVPPVNLDFARSMNTIFFFNETFAENIINPYTEEMAVSLAHILGFDEERWLEFTNLEEARCYLEYYLISVFHQHAPFLRQMFSFASYTSKKALQMNRHSLVNTVVWSLLSALRYIVPNEEYYQVFHFEANEYYAQPIDNQPLVDEGIVDEDDSLRGIDPIFLFVAELIDYSLRFNNLNGWTPAFDLEILRMREMSYFTENLGRAIINPWVEQNAVLSAQEWGFDEENWLALYKPCEAINFQTFYLPKILNSKVFIFERVPNEIRMFSFACYSSKLALRNNRNSLVNQVALALAHFLHHYYPHYQNYRDFDDLASQCNMIYLNIQSFSDDDGIVEVDNEVRSSSNESYEADISVEHYSENSDVE